MRAKYQAAQPEKTTVAEDLAAPQPQGIAAVVPQQAPVADPGIAGLPVPDQMFSGQGMAAGGIVAFDDGGDVVAGEKGMNLDELPSLNVNTGEQGYGGKSYYMTPDGNGLYAGRFFKDAYRQSPNPLFKLFSQLPNDKVFTRQMADGGEVKGFAGPDGSYVNPSLYGGPVQEYEPWYKSMKLFGDKYNLYGEGVLGPNPDQDTLRAFQNQRSMNPFISGMPRTDLADEYARLRLKASENKATQQDYVSNGLVKIRLSTHKIC
jgi:hypothetical protein